MINKTFTLLSKNKTKLYQSLQQKKYRDREKMFVVEGSKMVQEAILFRPQDIIEVICTASWKEENVINSETTIAEPATIKKISSLKSPQDVMAVLRINDDYNFKADKIQELTLILDNISDPGNLGTIIRLASWFGVKDIICSPESVDYYNPKVVQATMGAIFRTNLYRTDLKELVNGNAYSEYNFYGATLAGEDVFTRTISKPAFLIMGNESIGISDELLNKPVEQIKIPDFAEAGDKTESLNVASATAILLGEFKRQFHYSK